MPDPATMPDDDEETFCIYCQTEYSEPSRLRSHVLTDHPGTYRADLYEMADRPPMKGDES